MINEIIFNIKQDKKLYEYLKYHSYWYKELTYNPERIKDMMNKMKEELKETTKDKIEDFTNKLQLFSSLLEVLS